MTVHTHNTHSAIFAEVNVDEQLGVIRVTRIVSTAAAGRILNTKTASSQIMGSVAWGIGMALHEETLIDYKFGRVMNANMAEYHVPVNADVHDIQVIFVDEPDDTVNPLGIKRLGDRVELCASLLEGGLTPSDGVIRQALALASIPCHVIIRPRGGDFLFRYRIRHNA